MKIPILTPDKPNKNNRIYPREVMEREMRKYCEAFIKEDRTLIVSKLPEVVSDDGALNEYCQQVLTANPKSIADYKKGKVNALNHLKGQVMRLTKGKADILKVETILKSKMT